MAKHRLTPKQRALIEALFCKGFDFRSAVGSCDISQRILDRWLEQPRFREEFRRRLERVRFETQVDSLLSLSDAARNLSSVSNSANDCISYAASRDFIRLGNWLSRLPNPLSDQPQSHRTPRAFDALEKLLEPRSEERKKCA